MKELLSRFSAALAAEIAFIEEDGKDQSFELTSGTRDQRSPSGSGGLYVFLLADTLRLPEDASGSLRFGDRDCSAIVVAQEGNRIALLIEAIEPLPPYIPSARLVLSQTDLLTRLKERVEELHTHLGLAPKLFGTESATTQWVAIPDQYRPADLADSQDLALQTALGSEVTFLWGPPGTGKTFSIAILIASLIERGETVLVTSHTHAAVEQALWATVEPPTEDRQPGPLFDSSLVTDGKILKVGKLVQPKIPTECSLETFLEARAREREEQVADLLSERKRLSKQRETITPQLEKWDALERARRARAEAAAAVATSVSEVERYKGELNRARADVESGRSEIAKAEHSFIFGRKKRVADAAAQMRIYVSWVNDSERGLVRSQGAHAEALDREARTVQLLAEAESEIAGLAGEGELRVEAQLLADRLDVLNEQIREARDMADDYANELLAEARAIFATLTKLYMDPKLREREWDAVIVDEASMAMLPLLAFAAARARKRIIVVGDFYQLPPVVRSSEGPEHDLLAKDIFDFREITQAVDAGRDHEHLARLTVQRRMHPAIAEVARHLVYRSALEDHATTRTRSVPTELVQVLGTNEPLVIVDTADLRTWCGKMPGSLSRFNFYSGQAAVEIAAMYATAVPQPETDEPPRVGIVTPYSAQRRYLNKLIQTMGLQKWVMAGTVHTFQGSECDVIIFDSVLGEPHWSARLTNPHGLPQVRRDLNVAVTRARHQFVFVGDSCWLDKNANPGSGYGKLWLHLKAVAPKLQASDVLGANFKTRVATSTSLAQGWGAFALPEHMTVLDEKAFYPAFVEDLRTARKRVILYTPFIGKTRWPRIEPHIAALRERGVAVFLLHKPLSDPEWRNGDPDFGKAVLDSLAKAGVYLVPVSGVHAKTIVIDSHTVYDGSLNWASQTASYEHMWRMQSPDAAALIEKMLQLDAVADTYGREREERSCPRCTGPLVLVNQAQQNVTFGERQPFKVGCYRHTVNKMACEGYLRRIDARPPFRKVPRCERGELMTIHYASSGRPWDWRCTHRGCKPIRWMKGDVEPGKRTSKAAASLRGRR